MFNEKEIETYRSISAPTNLRKRVLSSVDTTSKKPNFTFGFRMTWGIAACFVLVMIFSVFTTETLRDTSVFIAGNTISPKTSIEVYPEYNVAPLRIQQTEEDVTPFVAFSITFDFPTKTKISVSDGEMQLSINDTVSSGTTFTVQNKVSVVWQVNPDDSDNAFVMNLHSFFKSETITLDYDETTDVWTLSR